MMVSFVTFEEGDTVKIETGTVLKNVKPAIRGKHLCWSGEVVYDGTGQGRTTAYFDSTSAVEVVEQTEEIATPIIRRRNE